MTFKPSKQQKAQSAMEYLMTYGWAILIIAVVLGALFSLGVFSGSNLLGSACIASSGYFCQNPIYSHSNGEIFVTLGQNTGTNWASANFVFVPEGTSSTSGLPSTLGSAASVTLNGNDIYGGGGSVGTGVTSGQTVQLWLPVNGVSTSTSTGSSSVGVPPTGAIWAQYTTSTGVVQYAQISTINIKAS